MRALTVTFSVAATLLCAAGLLSFLLYRPSERPGAIAQPGADHAQISGRAAPNPHLEARLDRLERDVSELDEEHDLLAEDVADLAEVAPAEADLTEAPSPDQDEEIARAQVALLDQTFAQEGQDPAWAGEAQAQLTSTFSVGSMEGLRGADLSCMSSMCKVEADFGDRSALSAALHGLPFALPWSSEGFYRADQGGRITFYIAREGRQLPHAG